MNANRSLAKTSGSVELPLWRRLLGVKRFPVTAGAVLAAAALAATVVRRKLWPLVAAALAQAFIPLPSKIEAAFLPPMHAGDGESDEGFAARVQASAETDSARVANAYRILFCREPDRDELAVAVAYLNKPVTGDISRWEQYAQMLLVSNEMLYVD